MPNFERHVFVCINERAPGHPRGCCKHKDGQKVRDQLKRGITARGLEGQVRANNAGCLDQCEHGVTVVVYPEQVWYGGVSVDDVDELLDKHIIGGEFVTRLMLPDQPHLGGATSGPALEIPDKAPDKAPAKGPAEVAAKPDSKPDSEI